MNIMTREPWIYHYQVCHSICKPCYYFGVHNFHVFSAKFLDFTSKELIILLRFSGQVENMFIWTTKSQWMKTKNFQMLFTATNLLSEQQTNKKPINANQKLSNVVHSYKSTIWTTNKQKANKWKRKTFKCCWLLLIC